MARFAGNNRGLVKKNLACTRPHSIGVESRGGGGGGGGGVYKSGEGGGPPKVGAIKGILTLKMDFLSTFQPFCKLSLLLKIRPPKHLPTPLHSY